MSNDNLKWISRKAFSYFDTKTSITLNVSTDTGMKKNGFTSFFPMRVCFQATDPRMERTNSRIKVELEFPHVNMLVDRVNKTISSHPDKKALYKTGSTVGVFKYNVKNKKELGFKFYYDNCESIMMKLTDPTSGRQTAIINLDEDIFTSIMLFLTGFKNNYNVIDATYTQALMSDAASDEIIQKLGNLDNRLTAIESKIKESNGNVQSENITEGGIMTTEAVDDYIDYVEDEPEIDKIVDTSTQDDFNTILNNTNGFSDVELDGPKEYIPKKQEIKTSQPFIESFLNWDMNRIKEWATTIVCTTDKATPEYFNPLELILNLCGIDDDTRRQYADDEHFYKSQYIMTKFVKDGVKNALKHQIEYPSSVPTMRFRSTIKRGTPLYNVGVDATVIYLIYSYVVNSYLKQIQTDDANMVKIDEYKRAIFVLKTIINPIIFSLEITDKFTSDLSEVFNNCVSGGLIKKFEEAYTAVGIGGKINLTLEAFDAMVANILKAVNSQPSVDINDNESMDNLMVQYGIVATTKSLNSPSDVKDLIFYTKDLVTTKEEVESNTKSRNDSVAILDESEPDITDSKLELFLECAAEFTNNGLVDRIRDNCQSFSELGTYFKREDIPSEMFKIKRIMDIDKSLTLKIDVLKMSKLLKEDSTVTESRVIQQEESSGDVNESQHEIGDVLDLIS
ncbi:MAG: hypothetical protein KAS32_14145 [Candidatus Peribacteraceae bacterium]|nr:hypothetical protein [Candidatus Peribacteraceae bacterium]